MKSGSPSLKELVSTKEVQIIATCKKQGKDNETPLWLGPPHSLLRGDSQTQIALTPAARVRMDLDRQTW